MRDGYFVVTGCRVRRVKGCTYWMPCSDAKAVAVAVYEVVGERLMFSGLVR